MNRRTKDSIAVLTLLITLLSLSIIEMTSAAPPPTPEFTVKAVDHSYRVPETVTTDPYTGKPVTTPAYTVENKTIDLTIKNQPFSFTDKYVYPAYSIRIKGHYEQEWRNISSFSEHSPGRLASHSEYTVISFPQSDYTAGGEVDFQVQAAIVTAHPLWGGSNMGYWTFETSGWSNIQTVTIPKTSAASPTPFNTGSSLPPQNPSATPNGIGTGTPFEFNIVEVAILVVLVVLAVLVAVLIVTLRRGR